MAEKKGFFLSSVSNAVRNFISSPSTTLPAEKKEADNNFNTVKVVPWYSGYNDFARVLVLMTEHANTHRRCIYTKAEFATAEGFDIVKGRAGSSIKTKGTGQQHPIPDEVITALDEFTAEVNNDGDSLKELARKALINYEATGIAFVELIKGEGSGGRFYKIYSHDSQRCLFKAPENAGDPATHVYISEDWCEDYIRDNAPRELPLWPQWEETNGAQRTVILLSNFSMGRDYYPLPTFIASFLAGRSEYESDRHNLERFYRDFLPDVFAEFYAPDGMSETDKEDFAKDFINTYTKKNREDAQGVMVRIIESEAMKANIHEFNKQGKEGDFIKLKDDSRQSVFTAHGWHPVLAGVPISGGLNDSKQLENLFKIYNRITIAPLQSTLCDQLINPIMADAAIWLNAPWKGYSLKAETTSPIGMFDAIDINKVTKVDEARKMAGLTAVGDDRGDFMVWEIGQQFNIQQTGGGLADGDLDKKPITE